MTRGKGTANKPRLCSTAARKRHCPEVNLGKTNTRVKDSRQEEKKWAK